MSMQEHTAPDPAVGRALATAKACRDWAWLPLTAAIAAVVAAPAFEGDAYIWQVRYLSYVVAAVLVLASVLLLAVCAVLRATAELLNRRGE